jgi:uncharacterized protein YegJ (DUF2314 family)
MNMKVRFALGLVILVGVAFWARESRRDPPGVISVSENDAEMNAAIARAQETLPEFIRRVQSPPPGQTALSLKARFEQGGAVEHMWIDDVSYDGQVFTGTLGDHPEFVTNVHEGQRVVIPPERVSDWMAIENDRLIGGTTVRVLWNRMSPEERKETFGPLRFD